MDIIMIKGATRVCGEEQGYIGLPIRDEVMSLLPDTPGVNVMATAWQPSPEDVAKIVAGQPLILRMAGIVPPPVMITVGDAE